MKNVMQINVYLTEHKYDHLLEGGNDDDDGGNSKHLLGVYGMLWWTFCKYHFILAFQFA